MLVDKDPMDRFVIAQAIAETMKIVMNDGIFASHKVKPLWQPRAAMRQDQPAHAT